MAVKVIIDNSASKVEGLTPTQFNELRELLSYEVDTSNAYFSGNYHSAKRYLFSKRNVFPTGLLNLVHGYLKTIPHAVIDNRRAPRPLDSTFKLSLTYEPYPEQKAIVEACRAFKRGFIAAPTGFGKSISIALLIARLNVRTLVVVPNLSLKQQLEDSFRQYFGSLKNIDVMNIDSPSLYNMTDYGCLIIDEAHHGAAKTYRDLNAKAWTKIYHRFCFSATPFRSKDEEQMLLESVTGQVIYKVDYLTAVEKGYIVPLEAYYIEMEPQPMDSNSWPAVYSKLVVNNEARNNAIAHMLTVLNACGFSTLCLVKEIAHGEILAEMTGYPFMQGINENNQELLSNFNSRASNSLIATTGVCGEGVDTKPCEYVILGGLGKSRPAFMQMCGRAFRTFPGKTSAKVILFKDKSHKFTLKHYNAQVKILAEEYGIKPVKLEI